MERKSTCKVTIHSNLFMRFRWTDELPTNFIVKAEIAPSGETNPNHWATKAKISDPAMRLAFCMTPEDGPRKGQIIYPSNNGFSAPYKANAFVDWMAGDSDEMIASRPRRFLQIPPNVIGTPEHMRIFIGGAYTDDEGKPCKAILKDVRFNSEEGGTSKRRRLDSDLSDSS
jgi:hypothetical protein